MNYIKRDLPFSGTVGNPTATEKYCADLRESPKTPLEHCQFSEALRKLRDFRLKGSEQPFP